MSGEGVIPSDPEIPFGRWHAGRNPRGATHPHQNTRDVRMLHSEEPPQEDGAGISPKRPASSFSACNHACLHQSAGPFGAVRK